MKHSAHILSVIKLLVALAIIQACETPFSYSLYDAKVPAEFRNNTEKNLQRIRQITTNDSVFKIALLADTHYHYDNLKAAINDINQKEDILFVIILGDLVDWALLEEYIFFQKVMKHLNKPYVTLIGNHDYLSNGEAIYKQMFGPLNYSFVFNNTKFVLFDDVFWESRKLPDFDWFGNALKNEEQYDHIIPMAHLPPLDNQFSDDHRKLYHQLMVDNDITISVHGHKHTFSLHDHFGDGVEYLTVGSPQHNGYCEITISPSQIVVQKIEYR